MNKYQYCRILLITIAVMQQATAQKIKPTLNHIAVYVFNLKTSTDFYQHVLQLDTVPEPFHDGRHTWFDMGSKSRLHLIQGAATLTPHEKNNHLCFSVASLKDFIPVLQKNSIEFENWAGEKNKVTKRVDGIEQIYFKDPDGYWIEINDAKE